MDAGSELLAPEWETARWFNTPEPLSLRALRGKVVVLEAFQLLCPGCVAHGLPQAKHIHESFSRKDVAVVGLHTVFEHHRAMGPEVLEAFLSEYRIDFPVGIDAPGDAATPVTMQRYELRGTPSLLLFDRDGRLVENHFGQVSDLRIGAQIASLVLQEPRPTVTVPQAEAPEGCDEDGCSVPGK